jgi:hypothetical protein
MRCVKIGEKKANAGMETNAFLLMANMNLQEKIS